SLLGGDRLASRNEIRKLALYVHGKERVELSDILAVVADASALAMDGLIDATLIGNTNEVNDKFVKTRAGGSSAAAIVSGVLRQIPPLQKIHLPENPAPSIKTTKKHPPPPIHFTREKTIREALRIWTPVRLLGAMQQLANASLDIRRNPMLAETLAHR